jgi:hypothetical protein
MRNISACGDKLLPHAPDEAGQHATARQQQALVLKL